MNDIKRWESKTGKTTVFAAGEAKNGEYVFHENRLIGAYPGKIRIWNKETKELITQTKLPGDNTRPKQPFFFQNYLVTMNASNSCEMHIWDISKGITMVAAIPSMNCLERFLACDDRQILYKVKESLADKAWEYRLVNFDVPIIKSFWEQLFS